MPVPSAGSSQHNVLLMIDLLLPLSMLEDIYISDSLGTVLCLGHHSFMGQAGKKEVSGSSWTWPSPEKFRPTSIMLVQFMEIFGHLVTKQDELSQCLPR